MCFNGCEMTVATGKGMQLAYNQVIKCGIQMHGLLYY